MIITDDKKRKTVFEALSRGAYDYFEKPVDTNKLKFMVDRAIHMHKLQAENKILSGK